MKIHSERKKSGKGLKYSFKRALSKEKRGALFVTIFVFGAIASLVGILGLLIACNVLVVTPFILGLLKGNPDVQYTDKNGSHKNGESSNLGIVDKVKETWNEAEPTKKAAILGGVGIMIPLLIVVVMWAAVMAVAFAVDLLIVVPIAFVVGFFIFRDPSKQNNQITKAIGHPIVGVISIVAVVAILIFAASQYMELTAMRGAAGNVAEYIDPISTDASDYKNVTYFDSVNGTWNNYSVPKVADKILFHVVDDYFYGAGFATYLDQTFDTTNNMVSVTDSSGQVPVANARFSVNGVRKDTGEYVHVGGVTDGSGDILLQKVPYGTYEFTVDAAGYLKFTKMDVHIQEAFDNKTVTIHLKPIYYKIGLEYTYYETEEYAGENFGLFGWGKRHTITQGGHVELTPFLAGALEKTDIDRLKRQQSMWGWTGIPSQAGLNNNVLSLKNTMLVTQNKIMNQLRHTFFALQSSLFTTKKITQDWNYGGHSVHTTQAIAYDATGFARDVYINQIPSPNTYTVTNNTGQSFEQYGISYASKAEQISGLTHCVHLYLVWSNVPEGQDLLVQFEVTTFVTLVNTTKSSSWFHSTKTSTESTIITKEVVDFKFRINLPTVETLVSG